MNYEKGKGRLILIVIIMLLLGGIIYFYPTQRILAEIKYKEYAKQQGVTEEDIVNIKFQKDYTQDGYYVDVEYRSDPNHRYQYHYFMIRNQKTGLRLNEMHCDIFDNRNHELDRWEYEASGVVYMPLEKDEPYYVPEEVYYNE